MWQKKSEGNMNLDVIKNYKNLLKINGRLPQISSICYNSKHAKKDSLFVCISGYEKNGVDYASDAIAKGASVIVHNGYKEIKLPENICEIWVKDSRNFLSYVSSLFYDNPTKKIKLIGVTGTNGKTTVAFLLESILSKASQNPGIIGTIFNRYQNKILSGNPLTTPESLDLQSITHEIIKDGAKSLVMEVSSHALYLKRVFYSHFDCGIFTNITRDHLDFHLSHEDYFNSKLSFFTEVLMRSEKKDKFAVLNLSDSYFNKIKKAIKIPYKTYSIKDKNADVHIQNASFSLDGIGANLSCENKIYEISSSLIGEFNLENILASFSACYYLGIKPEDIIIGISNLKNVPGRMEKIPNNKQITVLIDYAHTHDALSKALQTINTLKTKGKIITVFGCAGDRDKGKRPLMGRVGTEYSDISLLTSDNPRNEDPETIIKDIERGIKVKKVTRESEIKQCAAHEKIYMTCVDRREAIVRALSLAKEGDIIFVAGKGHEDYQVIGTNRIPYNDKEVILEALREKIK
jgi:UDP-N-acetylmuramoyl-L-alanyl-D-glutamate--2,6-diaminopimelate ligase